MGDPCRGLAPIESPPAPVMLVEPFRLVIFDLDGVLVDSFEAWRALLNELLQRQGMKPVSIEEFASTWGQDVEADRRRFFPEWGRDELERRYIREFPRFASRIRVEPGAAEVLHELKRRGRKLAVASNSPAAIVASVLQASGLGSRFDWTAGVDLVPRGKPEPDLVRYILDRAAIPASEACCVGDSVFDEAASRAAGIFFIGFRRDGDARIESLRDLLRGSAPRARWTRSGRFP